MDFNRHECTHLLHAKRVPVVRERRDGTEYRVFVMVGDKCGKPARFLTNGNPRCMKHRGP